MDIVKWLREFKLSTSDSNYNALIVNAKTEEAADEIERLRSQMALFDPSTTQKMAAATLNFANDEIKRLRLSLMTFADNVKKTNAGIDKNWAETVNSLKANNEQLRQQNAELRENNKLLYNLFHEAVALPQGACPRPATAGDGMFNPQHRALNKATGGE